MAMLGGVYYNLGLGSLRQKQAYLTGDKELDRTLRDMPVTLQRRGLRFATREAAKIVLADARRRIKRGSGTQITVINRKGQSKQKTLHLADSLTVRTAREGFKGRRLPRGTFGHAVVTSSGHLFKGDTFYGGFLELGWRHYKSGRFFKYPFLRPALYENKAKVRLKFLIEARRAVNNITSTIRRHDQS